MAETKGDSLAAVKALWMGAVWVETRAVSMARKLALLMDGILDFPLGVKWVALWVAWSGALKVVRTGARWAGK